MSLEDPLNLNNIASVLLGDGKWHEAVPETFKLSRYDPLHAEVCALLQEEGGPCHRAGGFSLLERTNVDGVFHFTQMHGSIASILAVRMSRYDEKREREGPESERGHSQ